MMDYVYQVYLFINNVSLNLQKINTNYTHSKRSTNTHVITMAPRYQTNRDPKSLIVIRYNQTKNVIRVVIIPRQRTWDANYSLLYSSSAV